MIFIFVFVTLFHEVIYDRFLNLLEGFDFDLRKKRLKKPLILYVNVTVTESRFVFCFWFFCLFVFAKECLPPLTSAYEHKSML